MVSSMLSKKRRGFRSQQAGLNTTQSQRVPLPFPGQARDLPILPCDWRTSQAENVHRQAMFTVQVHPGRLCFDPRQSFLIRGFELRAACSTATQGSRACRVWLATRHLIDGPGTNCPAGCYLSSTQPPEWSPYTPVLLRYATHSTRGAISSRSCTWHLNTCRSTLRIARTLSSINHHTQTGHQNLVAEIVIDWAA
jgi:hypothetical protein